MFSFEGEFRRKPIQSLGGASKHQQRDLFLQKTQLERQKREVRTLSLLNKPIFTFWFQFTYLFITTHRKTEDKTKVLLSFRLSLEDVKQEPFKNNC